MASAFSPLAVLLGRAVWRIMRSPFSLRIAPMRSFTLSVSLLLLLGSATHDAHAASSIVRIPDGDCLALSKAVESANGPTTILLARGGHYAGCGISMEDGTVVIDGQGSHMQYFSACVSEAPSSSQSNAMLTIRNMTIGAAANDNAALCLSGGTIGSLGGLSTYVGVFNAGSMLLDSVTFDGLAPPSSFYDGYIENLGSLVFRNVTVANVRQETAIVGTGAGSLIDNQGSMEIYNSTFVNNSAVTSQLRNVPLIDNASNGSMHASIKIANSLFTNNVGAACGNASGHPTTSVSLGGNFASEASCGFSTAAGDRIGADAGLAAYAQNGGLVPTQALAMTSPARGIGNPAYCEAVDARGQTRYPNHCDAGAFEFGGGQAQLAQGGMNGVFYNHAYNGHYVSIERLDTGNALVFWNTFDQLGNPAWVYGLATVNGKHLHADASQNLGAVLQPGTAPLGYHAQPWGSIDIDLTDCNNGTFAYHTTLPQFGSGQFALNRLTNVGDLQCTD
ncbi:MAG TPA: choice-of-anchor Q domain-containing protein [Rudaea sp.]